MKKYTYGLLAIFLIITVIFSCAHSDVLMPGWWDRPVEELQNVRKWIASNIEGTPYHQILSDNWQSYSAEEINSAIKQLESQIIAKGGTLPIQVTKPSPTPHVTMSIQVAESLSTPQVTTSTQEANSLPTLSVQSYEASPPTIDTFFDSSPSHTLSNEKKETVDNSSKTSSAEREGIVNKSNVNIRKKPDHKSPILDTVELNTLVSIIEEINTNGVLWYKIRYRESKTGYIRGDLINVNNEGDIKNINNKQDKADTSYETVSPLESNALNRITGNYVDLNTVDEYMKNLGFTEDTEVNNFLSMGNSTLKTGNGNDVGIRTYRGNGKNTLDSTFVNYKYINNTFKVISYGLIFSYTGFKKICNWLDLKGPKHETKTDTSNDGSNEVFEYYEWKNFKQPIKAYPLKDRTYENAKKNNGPVYVLINLDL